MKRKMLVVGMALGMTVLSSMTAMAGNWVSDSTGWWYQEDDNSYPSNTWKWIDSNNDGVSECYYFDANGYLLVNGTTPDNSMVDQNGAWIVDGVVQTKGEAASNAKGERPQKASQSYNPENNPFINDDDYKTIRKEIFVKLEETMRTNPLNNENSHIYLKSTSIEYYDSESAKEQLMWDKTRYVYFELADYLYNECGLAAIRGQVVSFRATSNTRNPGVDLTVMERIQ